MKKKVVLAIDQGTTGTRAILYDANGKVKGAGYQEFTQYYPKPGWVEHNPEEIFQTTLRVIGRALRSAKISSKSIAAIGITNQRETTLLWDGKTGKPYHRAIVWQDRRTTSYCSTLKKKNLESRFRNKTGLVLDPYFSGTKITWMLDHVKGLREKARKGRVLFGTIDTWLIWKLTGGHSHATDFTNASRTLLFNIKAKKWDDELLRYIRIPKSILPEAKESGALFGQTVKKGPVASGIPIHAVMGDQQAALYGQACYQSGQAKNTYGTGAFVVMNQGEKWKKIPFGLLGTIACDKEGRPVYAFEGSIFIAGAAIQWLRDEMKFFKSAEQSESIIKRLKDCGGVTMIPAFVGLGSPYWNADARGMISGITRGTSRAHIIRAALESIAHQTVDVTSLMEEKSGRKLKTLKVDGGATANSFLMQAQANLLGKPVWVSDISESTAWGVAKLAAYKTKFWPNLERIDRHRNFKKYRPRMTASHRTEERKNWKREINRVLSC